MAKNEESKTVHEAEVIEQTPPKQSQQKSGVTLSATQLLLLLIVLVTIGLTAGIVYVNNKVNDLQQPKMMRFQKYDDTRQRRPMQNQLGN